MVHRAFLLAAVTVLAIAVSVAAGHARAEPAAAESVAYEVRLAGLDDEVLAGRIRAVASLFAEADSAPPSLFVLERRAAADRSRIARLFESEGYYAATVAIDIDRDSDPAAVTVTVDRGPRYRLGDFVIAYADPESLAYGDLPGGLEGLGGAVDLAPGDPATAAAILDAADRVAPFLRRHGHPFAEVIRHEARIDDGARTVDVAVLARSGPRARFGATRFEGEGDVEADYLRRKLPWRAGDPYDESRVQAARRTYQQTGLFETVTIDHADAPDASGRLPVTVTLAPAEPRTVGAGLRYSTANGPSGRVFWRHRNILGRDEDLGAEAILGESEQKVIASFSKPDYIARDQTLAARLAVGRESFDAYDRRAIDAELGLDWPVADRWRAGAALSAEYAEVSDVRGTREVTLVGAPLSLNYDSTGDRLDPTEGMRLATRATPYTGLIEGAGASFLKVSGEWAGFVPLFERRLILAGRAFAGSIQGAGRANLPADKRFYAGGGGSVRGYGYQLAGDIGADGNPLGGRSVVEAGTELRWRFTDSFGLVGFVDAGRAYPGEIPDIGDEPFYGAGIGARYYSEVGPVRLDLAFPLDRRQGVDDAFQLYISLGQAF